VVDRDPMSLLLAELDALTGVRLVEFRVTGGGVTHV